LISVANCRWRRVLPTPSDVTGVIQFLRSKAHIAVLILYRKPKT